MGDTRQETDNFYREKRYRYYVVSVAIIGYQLLAYFEYLDQGTAFVLNGFNVLFFITNRFTTPSIDIFKHCFNVVVSLLGCAIFVFSPPKLMVCRLVTLINGVAIGFEQRTLFFKSVYSIASIVPWLFLSKYKDRFNLEEDIKSRFEQETALFSFFFILIMLAASRYSEIKISAMKAAEEALEKVKVTNALYEQANLELKRLLEDKDNFILLFSHETRNPLNILMGNLSILLTEVQEPRIRARLIRSKFCAELLLHNLNNILDTGKLSNKGTLEVTPTIVSTSQYLHSMWDIIKMMVMKKQLKPVLLIPRVLPAFVKIDAQKLSQIIINLVSNSVKFTDSGSISLKVTYLRNRGLSEEDFLPSSVFGNKLTNGSDSERLINHDFQAFGGGVGERNIEDNSPENLLSQECYTGELLREFKANSQKLVGSMVGADGNGYLKIEIIDTGCGIPEEDLKKLFQKFSQVNSDASKRQIGSGLGLWISKKLSELLGGSIRAYSKPKIGATFVVIVKADFTSTSSEITTRPKVSSSPEKKNSAQKILLVDDDPYNLETHFQLLKSLGFTQIDTVPDGTSLVKTFKSKPENYYSLIITDINMPNLDGIEAVRMIRQFEESSKRTCRAHIGFITGNSSKKEKQMCEGADIGGSFYIPKPVTLSALKGALQELGVNANEGQIRYLQPVKRKFSNLDSLNTEISTTKKKSKSPVVLCVDDDILNLEIFEDLVSDLGAKPIRATSGKEAIDVLRSKLSNGEVIDLVLIDCLMPGMDGWTACAEMKKFAPQVPVIGVTGDHTERHEESFKTSKMNEVVRKPVQREELDIILNKYI